MKRVFLFCLLTALLTSCLEYKEKMKIEKSGSGEVTFSIGISESLFNMNKDSSGVNEFDESKLKEKYSKSDGIKFLSSRTYSDAGNKWIEIKLGFDSLEKLVKASNDSSSQGMIGQISLKENKEGDMVYERILSNNQSGNDSTGDEIGKGIMESMFGGYKWTYEITLPGKIISTNAEPSNVDQDNNTVKWIIPMASLSKSASMKVTYEKSSAINLTLVFLLVIAAIALASVLLYLLKRKKDEDVQV